MNPAGEVLSPSEVFITWEPPEPEAQNGIIVSYTILLTELPTNTTFTYQRNGSHTEIIIVGLHPHYDYGCSIAAETSVGLGQFSSPFNLTTQQDGTFVYYCIIINTVHTYMCGSESCLLWHKYYDYMTFNTTAPSLPPTDVRLIAANSTSVQLSWQPPLLTGQNGIIQQYLIRVIEEETMRQFELMSTRTSATATDLYPYHTYSFTVAAVTVGQGPYSEEISVQTLEDGG